MALGEGDVARAGCHASAQTAPDPAEEVSDAAALQPAGDAGAVLPAEAPADPPARRLLGVTAQARPDITLPYLR